MKLSEFELEVMTLFWKDKSSTAPEIHRKISKNKKVTYSTVKTIIDRLEQKSALKRVKNFGRTIVYSPAVKQEELRKPLIKKFIDKVFSGNPRLLINHLLEEDQLSKEDIEYLKTIRDLCLID